MSQERRVMNGEPISSRDGNSGGEGLHNRVFSKVYTRRKFRSPTGAENMAQSTPVHESG